MNKYRKKPIVIDAIQFNAETKDRCFNFVTCNKYPDFRNGIPVLVIQTLEGNMEVVFGDYIIKGIQGEFYPCKEDIFNETYEEVSHHHNMIYTGVSRIGEIKPYEWACFGCGHVEWRGNGDS